MRLKDCYNIFNHKIISKNNNLFPKIISEQRGEKSNYFEEDLIEILKQKIF